MAPSRGPAPTPRTLHKTLSSHKGPVHVARYAKGTAKYVLSGGQDRTVRLWNPELGTEIKSYAAHGHEVLSLTVYVYLNGAHILGPTHTLGRRQGTRQQPVRVVRRGPAGVLVGRDDRSDYTEDTGTHGEDLCGGIQRGRYSAC